MWQNYVIISGLEEKDNKYKSALLLHSLGIEALRIYNGMKFDATKQEDKENPDHIIAKSQHSLHWRDEGIFLTL